MLLVCARRDEVEAADAEPLVQGPRRWRDSLRDFVKLTLNTRTLVGSIGPWPGTTPSSFDFAVPEGNKKGDEVEDKVYTGMQRSEGTRPTLVARDINRLLILV